MKPTDQHIRQFQETVYAYYRDHGRPFPWRDVTNPYDILVSEVMLQQTQAPRVVPKYRAFLERFPDVGTLAQGPLGDVLGLWQGLGYNRRAKALYQMAKYVAGELGGRLPDTLEDLVKLPGVGPYTAAAVLAFAYDRPVVLNETNIRSAFIHEFFGDRDGVHDRDVVPLIVATLDREHPREWYQALMDYGAMLKITVGNPSRRSAHYVRQSPLKGSSREARGAVLRVMTAQPQTTLKELTASVALAEERVDRALAELMAEGFITEENGRFRLAA